MVCFFDLYFLLRWNTAMVAIATIMTTAAIPTYRAALGASVGGCGGCEGDAG